MFRTVLILGELHQHGGGTAAICMLFSNMSRYNFYSTFTGLIAPSFHWIGCFSDRSYTVTSYVLECEITRYIKRPRERRFEIQK